jgi:hypothetical protein
MRLVLVVEQVDGAMPSADVELIRDVDGVIASATTSAFSDPLFQLRTAVDVIEASYSPHG